MHKVMQLVKGKLSLDTGLITKPASVLIKKIDRILVENVDSNLVSTT